MSLNVAVEKYSYSIPMELLTGEMALQGRGKDGLAEGPGWIMVAVAGFVGGIFVTLLARNRVPDKPAQRVEPDQREQVAEQVQPQEPQEPQEVRQPVQNERVDEINEQVPQDHRYNLRSRRPQVPVPARQVQHQDQGEERPTLYFDHNGHSGQQQVSAGALPRNAKKVSLKQRTYTCTYSAADIHLLN